MKILLNDSDKIKLDNLLNIKDTNIGLADFFYELISSQELFDEFNKDNSTSKHIEKMIIKHCEMDNFSNVFDSYCTNGFIYTNYEEFEQNPYKIHVKPQYFKEKNYSLEYIKYPKNTFFPYDDILVNKYDFKETSRLGISDKEYEYLSLIKDNKIWMCITPNEINTMKDAVNNANGNIVVFGLGLGYFAYMCSIKKNVNKITVIENDQNVINIFNNHILPFFEHKDKIKILKIDAFKFLDSTNLTDYDYAFFDLWHNANDGLPMYLKINSYSIKCKTDYWLETAIIALARRYLLTLIEESLAGYKDKDYLTIKNNDDRMLKNLYFKTKNIIIDNYTTLINFLSDINIKNIIKN